MAASWGRYKGDFLLAAMTAAIMIAAISRNAAPAPGLTAANPNFGRPWMMHSMPAEGSARSLNR